MIWLLMARDAAFCSVDDVDAQQGPIQTEERHQGNLTVPGSKSNSSVKARALVLPLPHHPPTHISSPPPPPPPSRWIEKTLLVTCWCTKKPHLMCWCLGQTRGDELSNITRPREPDGIPGKELEMEYYKHNGDEVIWGSHCGTYQRLILAHGYMGPHLQTRQCVTSTQDLT